MHSYKSRRAERVSGGLLTNKVTVFFATGAIDALPSLTKHGLDVELAMPAFFRLALMPVAVKTLSPWFSSGPHANFSSVCLLNAEF